MQELAIVGNFNGGFRLDDARSGLRDNSICFGFAHHLRPYFNIKTYDVSSYKKHGGISRLIGNNGPKNIFVIQNHIHYSIDIPERTVFYLHIDGHQSIHPNQITYAFYLFNGVGKHAYKTSKKQITILPFADMNSFNPNREKDILISDISREETFNKYKDLMERSEFTLVKSNHWLSKRVPEALACKTIPIVMTNTPHMQKLYSREHAPTIPFAGDSLQKAKGYTQERVDKAYEFLRLHHSLAVRVKKILPYLKKYAQ